MGYANGRIPLNALVHLGGDHYLPPGTAARWQWLQRLAHEKYGVWLYITAGWNAYRPYAVQEDYKRRYGNMAAQPGKSSHGGTYAGQVVFAIDVGNWGTLGWARFAAVCRLAGFTVNFVSPREEWHIGDFNDAWAIPSGAGTTPTVNPGTTNPVIYEEDEMLLVSHPDRGAATLAANHFNPLGPDELVAARRIVTREVGAETAAQFDSWKRIALGGDVAGIASIAQAVQDVRLPAQTAEGGLDPYGRTYPAGQMQASTDARVARILEILEPPKPKK